MVPHTCTSMLLLLHCLLSYQAPCQVVYLPGSPACRLTPHTYQHHTLAGCSPTNYISCSHPPPSPPSLAQPQARNVLVSFDQESPCGVTAKVCVWGGRVRGLLLVVVAVTGFARQSGCC